MINPLNPHYSLENPVSIYDEEAMTALELAGRTTAKVNEVVEAQNALQEATESHLQQQDADIENQKNTVIPNRIKSEVQRHIDNGDFDRQINTYAGNLREELAEGVEANNADMQSNFTQVVTPLQAQVDTLLGSLLTGSTTGDAELIDMRTNPDGTVSASAGAALRNHYPYNVPQTVDSSNYKELLPTLNIRKPTIYRLTFAAGDTEIPANCPFTAWPGGIGMLFTTCSHQLWDQDFYMAQVLILTNGVYYRWSSSEYQNWTCITDNNAGVVSNLVDIVENCPNINELTTPSITRFVFGPGTTNFPEGFPWDVWPTGSLVTLITAGGIGGTKTYNTQLLITCDDIYYRYAGLDWEAWHCLTKSGAEAPSITVDGSSLLEGVKKCYSQDIKKLIVQPGNYDLIAEYKAHYGSDYFENYVNYSTDDPFDRGLWLENIEVIFAPGAVVTCKYYGDNPNVKSYFSAIATGNDVTIDGLELDAENLRYGIHPDYTYGDKLATMVIRNSILSHKKGDTNCKAIGAGFGPHNDWLIENCVFKSNGITEAVFSCHNSNWTADVQSRLTVRNCYIEGAGFFKFTHYGDSVKKSVVMVTGCSYVNEPVLGFESSLYTAENIALYKWGNDKRTN